MAERMITVAGSCHCGAVKFEADVPSQVTVQTCNCSICIMTGFVHLIIPETRFRLLSGAEHLTSYRFNTGVADHRFCSICGVKPFYRPRSNPDGYSLNFNCLDASVFENVTVEDFDGQNWEANAASLAHLSKE